MKCGEEKATNIMKCGEEEATTIEMKSGRKKATTMNIAFSSPDSFLDHYNAIFLPLVIAIKETSHVGNRTQSKLTQGVNDLGMTSAVSCTCKRSLTHQTLLSRQGF